MSSDTQQVTIDGEVVTDNRRGEADDPRGPPPSNLFLYHAPADASWEQLGEWWRRLEKEGLV